MVLGSVRAFFGVPEVGSRKIVHHLSRVQNALPEASRSLSRRTASGERDWLGPREGRRSAPLGWKRAAHLPQPRDVESVILSEPHRPYRVATLSVALPVAFGG